MELTFFCHFLCGTFFCGCGFGFTLFRGAGVGLIILECVKGAVVRAAGTGFFNY